MKQILRWYLCPTRYGAAFKIPALGTRGFAVLLWMSPMCCRGIDLPQDFGCTGPSLVPLTLPHHFIQLWLHTPPDTRVDSAPQAEKLETPGLSLWMTGTPFSNIRCCCKLNLFSIPNTLKPSSLRSSRVPCRHWKGGMTDPAPAMQSWAEAVAHCFTAVLQ